MAMHIVLVEPEIPQNTGNISRTCAATGAHLHLAGKLGFSLDDRYLKRAGLDYWPLLKLHIHDTLEDCMAALGDMPRYFLTTKAAASYCDADYPAECALFFGKETKGLDEKLLRANEGSCIRIPMLETARSLNLSNSVAIVLYEALRRQGFDGFKTANDYLREGL